MTRRQRIDDLTAFAVPEQPALSPDGSQIVYVLRTERRGKRPDRHARCGGSAAARGEPAAAHPRPGRRRARLVARRHPVAFLRAGTARRRSGCSRPTAASRAADDAAARGRARPVWSPDGSQIAFGAPVDLHAGRGRRRPSRAPPRRSSTERLDYQADGAGLLRTIRKHLHVVDGRRRECRQVTERRLARRRPGLVARLDQLAFAAATAPDADLIFRAPVYTLDVDPAGRRSSAGRARRRGRRARRSGRRTAPALLVVGTVGRAGRPRRGCCASRSTAASRVDLAGAARPQRDARRARLPGRACRSSPATARTVLFCVRDRGCTHLYARPGRRWRAAAAASPAPGRVVAGPVGRGRHRRGRRWPRRPRTARSSRVDLATGAADGPHQPRATSTEVELFTREERAVQRSPTARPCRAGWSATRGAPGPQPLLLDIHGGPHNAWNGAADDGAPLPPGARGARLGGAAAQPARQRRLRRGASTTRALGALGRGRRARTSSSRSTRSSPRASPTRERLAVTGYSYGGYMTCYLTSRDDRFAAAVAGGVVSDLVSMAGTSDDGHHLGRRSSSAARRGPIGDRYERDVAAVARGHRCARRR